MSSKNLKQRVSMFLLILGVVAVVPAFAGSAVIGSVAGSMNATVGGQALLPNTTIFSGDSLQVKDGAAVVAMGSGSRMVFGRDTVASFLRDSDEVTVLLGQGNVSMYHPDSNVALRVKVGDVSVMPAKGFKTLGDVAMVNGTVVVTAKEGLLRVEGNGPAVEVAKGKTITVLPKAAKAPQGGAAGAAGAAGGGLHIGALAGVQLGLAGLGTGFSVAAAKKASDANSSAQAANSTAQSAVNAANDANDSAQAATAAAEAAQESVNAVGCALDTATNTSVYIPPPSGCP